MQAADFAEYRAKRPGFGGKEAGAKRYTAQEKARALAILQASGNMTEAAREAGVSRQALSNWKLRTMEAEAREERIASAAIAVGTPTQAMVQVEADGLTLKLRQIANASADRLLAPGVMQTAQIKEAAATLGMSVDKLQLLLGAPTSIEESRVAYAQPGTLKRLSVEMLELDNG